jgi:hypothetical protein
MLVLEVLPVSLLRDAGSGQGRLRCSAAIGDEQAWCDIGGDDEGSRIDELSMLSPGSILLSVPVDGNGEPVTSRVSLTVAYVDGEQQSGVGRTSVSLKDIASKELHKKWLKPTAADKAASSKPQNMLQLKTRMHFLDNLSPRDRAAMVNLKKGASTPIVRHSRQHVGGRSVVSADRPAVQSASPMQPTQHRASGSIQPVQYVAKVLAPPRSRESVHITVADVGSEAERRNLCSKNVRAPAKAVGDVSVEGTAVRPAQCSKSAKAAPKAGKWSVTVRLPAGNGQAARAAKLRFFGEPSQADFLSSVAATFGLADEDFTLTDGSGRAIERTVGLWPDAVLQLARKSSSAGGDAVQLVHADRRVRFDGAAPDSISIGELDARMSSGAWLEPAELAARPYPKQPHAPSSKPSVRALTERAAEQRRQGKSRGATPVVRGSNRNQLLRHVGGGGGGKVDGVSSSQPQEQLQLQLQEPAPEQQQEQLPLKQEPPVTDSAKMRDVHNEVQRVVEVVRENLVLAVQRGEDLDQLEQTSIQVLSAGVSLKIHSGFTCSTTAGVREEMWFKFPGGPDRLPSAAVPCHR